MNTVPARLVGLVPDVAAPGPAEMKRKVESNWARWAKLAQEMNIQPLD